MVCLPFFVEVVLFGVEDEEYSRMEEAWAIPDASRGPYIFL